MRDDGSQFDEGQRTGVERLITRDLDEDSGKGRPLSERARQSVRSVEAYLKGGVRPRWMERVGDIDGGLAHERRLLADARARLLETCARDGGSFAERWRTLASDWPFPTELIELIDQHNEWYPIERDLPFNPRTGDYVRVNGRSYRRPQLGPEWILEQFPAQPPPR
ncbi:MAG TPA: hypothetical protein VHZ31_01995 [Solirubrobacteraceae bacterium]|nr:hypothetical protein [Solirubrobacteraceae bacterium]